MMFDRRWLAAHRWDEIEEAIEPLIEADLAHIDEDARERMRGAILDALSLRWTEARMDRDVSTAAGELMPEPSTTAGRDLLAEPDDTPSWRISQLWPSDGNVVLAAARKAGKTTLVANVLAGLTDGRPLFAGIERSVFDRTYPVRALGDDETVTLIDLEMSRRLLRELVAGQRIEHLDRLRVETLRGQIGHFDVLDAERRAIWAKHLIEHRTKVLVVDPLAPLLAHYGYEENDNAGIAVVLDALDELRAMAGIDELLVCHHMGHAGERSRGASRLRDWPDVEWRLVRERPKNPHEEPPPDAARFFIAEGRADVAVPETRLEMDRSTHRLTLAGGNRREHKLTQHTVAVRAVIEAHPWSSKTRIITLLRGTGTGSESATAALEILTTTGQIRTRDGSRGSTLYALSDGRQPADDPTAAPAS